MRILKYKKTDRAKAKGQKRHAQNAERVKLHVTTGDTVRIVETRPLSKDKRWRVVEIMQRAR
jgi:small subunit ribosomal protein S17